MFCFDIDANGFSSNSVVYFGAKVLDCDSKCLEDAIRCGGLAPTKARCIKNTLACLLERKGKLCLEYLRGFSIDQVKAELSHFKGIGPKTVIFLTDFHFLNPPLMERKKSLKSMFSD